MLSFKYVSLETSYRRLNGKDDKSWASMGRLMWGWDFTPGMVGGATRWLWGWGDWALGRRCD